MKIAISGSTGFIGKQLTDYLLRSGNEILMITRRDFADPDNKLTKIVNSADVIINLAGSSVLCRWNEQNMGQICSSRLETTRLLVSSLDRDDPLKSRKIFINASAIGIYQDSGIHDEESTALGNDFLANLCKKWEQELEPLGDLDCRTSIIRIGIVLGTSGGSLAKMIPIFKAGLGGKIGSGKQPFSFIHITDFCRAIEHIILNSQSSGIYNLVAPEFTTNDGLTKALAKSLHRPAFFTVPEFGLKLVYGKAAQLLTQGVAARPQKLLNEDFKFLFPDISTAISDLVSKD
jgi:uncharacterized protein